MYSVSEAYIEQMMHRATRRRLTGVIGSNPGVAFSGNDVVSGTFEISGRATTERDTKIGGVYLGELSLTFVPSFLELVPRTEFRNKEITVAIGLWIPDPTDEVDGGTWVDVPVGVYTLQAPKISKRGVSVTGYDHMAKLDKKFNLDTTSATPYGYLSYIGTACGVQIGMTQEEVEALPNGGDLLGLYPENDIETYRDLLYWVAQACGCFACADRQGAIVLRRFGNPTGVTLDEVHRDTDVVFSGYVTKWTGIYVVDITTQLSMYYGLEVDDGLTMSLGANPLLQLGSADAVDRRRRAVLNAIAQIQYTPFYCNSARDPIFDLGDEIPFTGGISGNCTGVCMAYTYTLDNYTFEGYGDDPALASARSKTDKNIAGLLQSTTENEVTYYNYANLEALSFGSEQEVPLASISFTSAQPTTVKILHEFIFDLLSDLALDGSYELRYYLDEELLPYGPYERLGAIAGLTEGDTTDLSITRDFFYVVSEVEPNVRHTWRVSMIAHNIDAVSIDVGHAHVTIEGQRLYGDQYFDGYIEARDDFSLFPIGSLEPIGMVDDADIDTIAAAVAQGSDEIGLFEIASLEAIPITDSLQIFIEGGFYIATEDGKCITTEDDKRIITE